MLNLVMPQLLRRNIDEGPNLVVLLRDSSSFILNDEIIIVYHTQWQGQPDIWLCKFFCFYRPYKEYSKEMNNDIKHKAYSE